MINRVRLRIAYAAQLWQQGIRFDQLICLGTERKLDAEVESKEIILDISNAELPARKDWQFDGQLPTNEYEMMKFVLDQADLPAEMHSIPLQCINTPMIKSSDGSVKRPGAGETILALIDQLKFLEIAYSFPINLT